MSNFVDAPLLSSEYRVCIFKDQGGRNHMEDVPVFVRNNYDGVPEGVTVEPYEYIAIFDGHGGHCASEYAGEHLLKDIISQKEFWSDQDSDILGAIRQGFIDCHYRMWEASSSWPQSSPGIMCTAGTTASVAFIRHGKVYVGHVGDSGIALGKVADQPASGRPENRFGNGPSMTSAQPRYTLRPDLLAASDLPIVSKLESRFEAVMLTKDHKPEAPEEKDRIQSLGGEVRSKSGVHRVVWKRPVAPIPGTTPGSPVFTQINPVPFLAVARSLGDFWSFEEERNEFVVSPVPDVAVHSFVLPKHRCLVAGSDGLWNVVRPNECLDIVEEAYRLQELWMWQCIQANKRDCIPQCEINVAELLARKVLNRCELRKMRSDNVGIVVYYPAPSEDKIRHLVENLSEASMYPWFQNPDLGIAQYRHTLMTLQNLVSCIGAIRLNFSVMEVAYRIDTIGFSPRLSVNPLRETFGNGNHHDIKDVAFDVDLFVPQCALVITKDDETVRVPAYSELLLDDELAHDTPSRLNPLRKRNSDILLSQKIKFLRTHSSNNFELRNANGDAENHLGFMHGSKRIRMNGWNGERPSEPGIMPLSSLFPNDDVDDLGAMKNLPYITKDQG